MQGKPRTDYLLLFAKYPYLGLAKTRLEPALGRELTQRFAQTALMETLQYFSSLSHGSDRMRLVWCFAPQEATEDVMRLLKGKGGLVEMWETWPQPDDAFDLGARLSDAVKRVGQQEINNESTCTLIGADCFALTLDHVRQGRDSAKGGQPRVVPAIDGGYVLLSLPTHCVGAFKNIRWSTKDTCNDQQKRLEGMGLVVNGGAEKVSGGKEETPLRDVDVPEDLDFFMNDGAQEHLQSFYPRLTELVHTFKDCETDEAKH